MQVRPEEEQRERERDPPRRRARVGDEQPHQGGEHDVGQGLRTQEPIAGKLRDRECGDERDAAGAAAESTGSDDRKRKRSNRGRGIAEEGELDTAEERKPAEEDLRKPLLVDPPHALRPRRVRIDGR